VPATLAPPTAAPRCRAVTPPPGARDRDAYRAPAPVVCGHCGGEGLEPEWELAAIPCWECSGGVLPLKGFALPRTRTCAERLLSYESGRGRLTLVTAGTPGGRKATYPYFVVETECEWDGRGFLVAAADRPDRLHRVYAGPDGYSCSCEGETYLSAAKANQRAHDAGAETYPTYGCRHLDCVVALLTGGWFDLGSRALPMAPAAARTDDAEDT
jgi:hypothetical protein